MRTQSKILLLVVLLVALVSFVQSGFTAEATYVGNITDDLRSPTSLLVTDDGIAVLEPFSRQVIVFSAGGILTSRVDVTGEIRALARLEQSSYLFCERTTGNVFKVNLETAQQDVFLANAGDPVDVIVSDQSCRILDAGSSRVLISDLSGRLTSTVQLNVPSDLSEAWLSDLAWDQSQSRYYAWDQTNSLALAFSATGSYLGQFSSFGSDTGSVTRGGEIVCDQDGWIFITDRYQGQVVVFDPDWNFVLNIKPETMDQTSLVLPAGLAVDPTGLVYVACTEGPAIEVFHLNKAPAPSDLPSAAPVSPADGDTLTAGSLWLVAGIQAPANLAAGLKVEFQVFDWSNMTEVVAEVQGLDLDEFTIAGELVVGTVKWDLPRNLNVGQSYGWKSRATSGSSSRGSSTMTSMRCS